MLTSQAYIYVFEENKFHDVSLSTRTKRFIDSKSESQCLV